MKYTPNVVKWFEGIPDKSVSSLVNFDVKNFYPSISMKLFTDSIKYARNLIEITDKDLLIIMQARKTLLLQAQNHGLKNQEPNILTSPWGAMTEQKYVS